MANLDIGPNRIKSANNYHVDLVVGERVPSQRAGDSIRMISTAEET